jgi:hypothetical protein
MANIISNEGELFRKTLDDTARSFSSVKNGKGSRWRTLPTDRYKQNYDDIFGKKDKYKKKKEQDDK